MIRILYENLDSHMAGENSSSINPTLPGLIPKTAGTQAQAKLPQVTLKKLGKDSASLTLPSGDSIEINGIDPEKISFTTGFQTPTQTQQNATGVTSSNTPYVQTEEDIRIGYVPDPSLGADPELMKQFPIELQSVESVSARVIELLQSLPVNRLQSLVATGLEVLRRNGVVSSFSLLDPIKTNGNFSGEAETLEIYKAFVLDGLSQRFQQIAFFTNKKNNFVSGPKADLVALFKGSSEVFDFETLSRITEKWKDNSEQTPELKLFSELLAGYPLDKRSGAKLGTVKNFLVDKLSKIIDDYTVSEDQRRTAQQSLEILDADAEIYRIQEFISRFTLPVDLAIERLKGMNETYKKRDTAISKDIDTLANLGTGSGSGN